MCRLWFRLGYRIARYEHAAVKVHGNSMQRDQAASCCHTMAVLRSAFPRYWLIINALLIRSPFIVKPISLAMTCIISLSVYLGRYCLTVVEYFHQKTYFYLCLCKRVNYLTSTLPLDTAKTAVPDVTFHDVHAGVVPLMLAEMTSHQPNFNAQYFQSWWLPFTGQKVQTRQRRFVKAAPVLDYRFDFCVK